MLGNNNVDEDSADEMENFSDEVSSSPTIEDIDFSNVYALHTFLATVDGQASVVKGDSLTLLDDSNSYWWLVKVLKTSAVGYIPAENIETPNERLARLNKHRNVDLTTVIAEDHITGPKSALAKNRLVSPPPTSRIKSPSPQPSANNSKSVGFTTPIYHEHSGYEYTTSEEDEMFEGDGFDDDDDEEDEDEEVDEDVQQGEEEASDLEDNNNNRQQHQQDYVDRQQEAAASAMAHRNQYHQQQLEYQQQHQQQMQQQQQQQQPQQAAHHRHASSTDSAQYANDNYDDGIDGGDEADDHLVPRKRFAPEQNVAPLRTGQNNNNQQLFSADSQTTIKKTLTPELFTDQPRSSTPNSNNNGNSANANNNNNNNNSINHKQNLSASNNSDALNNSVSTTTSTESVGTDDESKKSAKNKDKQNKEKKGSGVFSNLFGRKKDKRSKKSSEDQSAEFRASDDSLAGRANSPIDPPQDTHINTSTPDSFTNAALKQQRVEAQQAMYQNFGITRGPNDKTNVTVFKHQQHHEQQQQEREGQYQDQRPNPQEQQQDDQQQSQQLPYSQPQRSPQEDFASYVPTSASTGGIANPSTSLALSTPSTLQPANNASTTNRQVRPGSLIGAPGSGLEVPTLSVLRVFAGDNVTTDSTFKTVLLNSATSTSDLVYQIVQRFRLPLDHMEDYTLTIKDIDGEETVLESEQKPLNIFEQMGQESGRSVPSVNRSSIGSISSVASDLSLNPAISKLGMNDYSDDSTVKFFINRKNNFNTSTDNIDDVNSNIDSYINDLSNGVSVGNTNTHRSEHDNLSRSSGTESLQKHLSASMASDRTSLRQSLSGPSYRIVLRILINSEDLPDGMVFDTNSPTAISRSNSNRSVSNNPSISSTASSTSTEKPSRLLSSHSSSSRERILYFPANSIVAEVIELGLEKFGILEGVVDGGDDVEEKISRRKSMSRIRYCLTIEGQADRLNPSTKIVDAYDTPPILKPNERSSKEFRRRSSDMNSINNVSNAITDIQDSDPVFVLRRAIPRSGPQSPRNLPKRSSTGGIIVADELDQHHLIQQQQKRFSRRAETDSSVPSMYETPTDDSNMGTSRDPSPAAFNSSTSQLNSPTADSYPSADRTRQQEIIAQQRAAQQASQRALLSSSSQQLSQLQQSQPQQLSLNSTSPTLSSGGLPDEPRSTPKMTSFTSGSAGSITDTDISPNPESAGPSSAGAGELERQQQQQQRQKMSSPKNLVYSDSIGLDNLFAIIDYNSRSSDRKLKSDSLAKSDDQRVRDDLFGTRLTELGLPDEVFKTFENHHKRLEDLDSTLDSLLVQAWKVL